MCPILPAPFAEKSKTLHVKMPIAMVTKPNLEYLYDAMGNRITKIVKPAGSTSLDWVYTHYVRDAQSNVIATYKKENINQSTSYQLTERHIYGSSRVGIDNKSIELIGYTAPSDDLYRHQIGRKNYELTNHLGNVNAVITDRKIPRSTNGLNIDYYMPDIVSATDYYPFGAIMPGRNYNAGTYRYSYSGMEQDNEIKGTGNSLDFGARIYDPRLGRWLSTDPLQKEYAFASPYSFVLNTPIQAKDPDGRLVVFVNGFRSSAYKRFVYGLGLGKAPWNKTPLYDTKYSFRKDGASYWNEKGANVDGQFMSRFNDRNAIYVDGMYKPQSSGQDRYDRGVADAQAIIKKIEAGEIEYKAGETIKLVGHSHGGWHATGMADAFAKAGYNVEGLYAINPHQPNQDVTRLEGVPDYYSAQYSRKSDHVSSDQSKLGAGQILVGDSEYGQMKGYDANVQLTDMPGAELGGHNVEDGVQEIMSIGEGCEGEVCPGPTEPKK